MVYRSQLMLGLLAGFLFSLVIGCGQSQELKVPTPKDRVEEKGADGPKSAGDSGGTSKPESGSGSMNTDRTGSSIQESVDPSDVPVDAVSKGSDSELLDAGSAQAQFDLSPPGKQGESDLPGRDEGLAGNETTETGLAKIPLPEDEEDEEEEIHTIEFPKSWKRLSPTDEIWLDKEKKQVITGGRICLDRGGLEMFICPDRTKEHESVISVRAKSFQIHATLLALGLKPGKPVDWGPPYVMATGPKIKITVMWVEDNAKPKRKEGEEYDYQPMVQPDKLYPVDAPQVKRVDGREMVRNFETKKTLDVDWVFGGSLTEKLPDGSSYYYGDGGELVCVSNFATATMDLPIRSSQAKGNLMFEVNSDKVPRRNTKVYVIFEEKE